MSEGRLRLRELVLTHFKPFYGRTPTIDFDADLILLVGANGRGKSSLMESIEMALSSVYWPRVGGGIDFELGDLINRRHQAECLGRGETPRATIALAWSDGSTSEVRISPGRRRRAPLGGAVLDGGWLEGREAWREDERLQLLRSSTFLYSESLGSSIGVDIETRRQVLDFFVPQGERLREVKERLGGELGRLVGDMRRRLEGVAPDLGHLELGEREAAAAVEALWQRAAQGRLKLRRPGGGLYEERSLVRSLREALTAEGEEGEGTLDELMGCLAALAERRAQLLRERRAEAAGGAGDAGGERPAARYQRLCDALAALGEAPGDVAAAERELAALGDPERLAAERAALLDEMERNRTARARLFSAAPALPLPAPGGIPAEGGYAPVPVGTLPLLASLRELGRAEDARPSWWEELGLGRLDVARIESLLGAELAEAERREAEAHALAARLAEVSAREKQASGLRERLARLEAVERAWRAAFPGQPLPRVAGDAPGGAIDLAAVGRGLGEATGTLGAGGGAPLVDEALDAWTHLGEACQAWLRARGARRTAEAARAEVPHLEETLVALERLAAFAAHLGSEREDFAAELRTRLIEAEYREPLERAMRHVLRGYAHVMEEAHLSFERRALRVLVGASEAARTGLVSLSRSQLTSIAFSLMIATNLGHPSLPTGFLCIDDLSDVFDLTNLAADAGLLRRLAYGPEDTRRQLIVTSHHDELTDRLVPLLRPPAGCSMRIIELRNDPVEGATIAQWQVRGEGRAAPRVVGTAGGGFVSPLRALLPEAPGRPNG